RRYLHGWNNVEPWHYYIHKLPLDLLPWSPFLVLGLILSWRSMSAAPRRFLWSWMGGIFLFFSVSSCKRGVYLLPLYPAAAVLIGWCMVCGMRGRDRIERVGEAAARWLTVLLPSLAGATLLTGLLIDHPALRPFTLGATLMGLLGVGGAVALAMTPVSRLPVV